VIPCGGNKAHREISLYSQELKPTRHRSALFRAPLGVSRSYSPIEDGVAFAFEPPAKQRDLCAAAHSIGTFDDDELA